MIRSLGFLVLVLVGVGASQTFSNKFEVCELRDKTVICRHRLKIDNEFMSMSSVDSYLSCPNHVCMWNEEKIVCSGVVFERIPIFKIPWVDTKFSPAIDDPSMSDLFDVWFTTGPPENDYQHLNVKYIRQYIKRFQKTTPVAIRSAACNGDFEMGILFSDNSTETWGLKEKLLGKAQSFQLALVMSMPSMFIVDLLLACNKIHLCFTLVSALAIYLVTLTVVGNFLNLVFVTRWLNVGTVVGIGVGLVMSRVTNWAIEKVFLKNTKIASEEEKKTFVQQEEEEEDGDEDETSAPGTLA